MNFKSSLPCGFLLICTLCIIVIGPVVFLLNKDHNSGSGDIILHSTTNRITTSEQPPSQLILSYPNTLSISNSPQTPQFNLNRLPAEQLKLVSIATIVVVGCALIYFGKILLGSLLKDRSGLFSSNLRQDLILIAVIIIVSTVLYFKTSIIRYKQVNYFPFLASYFPFLNYNLYSWLISNSVSSLIYGVIILIILGIIYDVLFERSNLLGHNLSSYVRPIVIFVFFSLLPQLHTLWSISEVRYQYPAALAFFKTGLFVAFAWIGQLLNIFELNQTPSYQVRDLIPTILYVLDTYSYLKCTEYFNNSDLKIIGGIFRIILSIISHISLDQPFPFVKFIGVAIFSAFALLGSSFFYLETKYSKKNQALLLLLGSVSVSISVSRSTYSVAQSQYDTMLLSLPFFALISFFTESLTEWRGYFTIFNFSTLFNPSTKGGVQFYLLAFGSTLFQLIYITQAGGLAQEFGVCDTLFFGYVCELLLVIFGVLLITREQTTIIFNFLGLVSEIIAGMIHATFYS